MGAARPDALPEAVIFLSDLLAEGPCRRADVHRRGQVHRISERSLERAKAQLHVVSEQRGESKKNVWYWRLPNAEETAEILTDLWSAESKSGGAEFRSRSGQPKLADSGWPP